ncbi:hypothetical protein GQ600_18061 [Phytophthora cactorum]|nr:hypothetical protein GQ600_18061 [Phytophthora cactorum]
MAEAPEQKPKYGKASGARKRRRVRSSLEGAPTETASRLGGVVVFKDVWGWLTVGTSTFVLEDGTMAKRDCYLPGELAVL